MTVASGAKYTKFDFKLSVGRNRKLHGRRKLQCLIASRTPSPYHVRCANVFVRIRSANLLLACRISRSYGERRSTYISSVTRLNGKYAIYRVFDRLFLNNSLGKLFRDVQRYLQLDSCKHMEDRLAYE